MTNMVMLRIIAGFMGRLVCADPVGQLRGSVVADAVPRSLQNASGDHAHHEERKSALSWPVGNNSAMTSVDSRHDSPRDETQSEDVAAAAQAMSSRASWVTSYIRWASNCYEGHGASDIGGDYGKIGHVACAQQCRSHWECRAYVVSRDGECWLRSSLWGKSNLCERNAWYDTGVMDDSMFLRNPYVAWDDSNCYTDDSNMMWYGALNIGGSAGRIGRFGCQDHCKWTLGCTCYVVSRVGECWLRAHCERWTCASDPFYTTFVQ